MSDLVVMLGFVALLIVCLLLFRLWVRWYVGTVLRAWKRRQAEQDEQLLLSRTVGLLVELEQDPDLHDGYGPVDPAEDLQPWGRIIWRTPSKREDLETLWRRYSAKDRGPEADN